MPENRRVSLPVIRTNYRRGPPSPGYMYPPHPMNLPEGPEPSPTLLTPCGSPFPMRRSLPSTPRGHRRSLPGTPRCLSPRPPTLPDLDEYFPTSSSGASSRNSSCETSPRRRQHAQRKTFNRPVAAMRDSGFVETNSEEGGQLRSFDVTKGCLVDRGFEKRKASTSIIARRAEARRATCPEIWLSTETTRPVKRVVLRVYGSHCAGKKTLSQQIYHHAATATAEEVNVLSSECDDDSSRTINFLLNGEEIQLEIVQESALESSPFSVHQTMFMIVYNVTCRDTFTTAANILYRIFQHRKKTRVPVLLVGNKIDLQRKKVVSAIEGRMLAKIYKCSFLEVSGLMSMNVDVMWRELLKQMNKPVLEERTLISKIVERGRNIARSCEEIVQRMMRHENSQSDE